MEKSMRKFLLISALPFAILGSVTPLSAQENPERSVDQYKCKDFMRETGTNRDVAIAFLHGFLLGKSGDMKFNLDTLKKQSDAFIEHCLDEPNAQAMEVMLRLKK